jgi:hypothetical protein
MLGLASVCRRTPTPQWNQSCITVFRTVRSDCSHIRSLLFSRLYLLSVHQLKSPEWNAAWWVTSVLRHQLYFRPSVITDYYNDGKI